MNYFNSVKPPITTTDELNKKNFRNDLKLYLIPF